MFESEVNDKKGTVHEVPKTVRKKFIEFNKRLHSRSLLPWTEHCVECVWPSCYSTCDLYEPRKDGKCQRFRDGMVKIDLNNSANDYLLKITFKKWGKLLAQGNTYLFENSLAKKKDKKDQFVGRILRNVPAPKKIKSSLLQKRYGDKNRNSKARISSSRSPESFAVEVYNPLNISIDLTVTIRPDNSKKQKLPFQKLLTLSPGYNLTLIKIEEILSNINLDEDFKIEITPNTVDTETTLYFGIIDFIQTTTNRRDHSRIKCVIWDLDNTLWEGILVEENSDNHIQLKPGIKDIIIELDNRGILQSIASKNNKLEALNKLKAFGIDEYFLKPQISWEPKSQSIFQIAKELNIGIDTFLFIDDQPFEREEVKSMHPEIKVLDADKFNSVLKMPELNFTVSKDAKRRRKLYLDEDKRKESQNNFEGDYFDFLKKCNLHMTIEHLHNDNLERVHELTQRTNQMNFSGNRYDKHTLENIIQNQDLDSFVLKVKDKFGEYGIVGFGLVNNTIPALTDLMFSCRIQSKRVEHAFLSYILKKYSYSEFLAYYNRTKRNEPSGKVFNDFGFKLKDKKNGFEILIFNSNQEVLDDDLITITS